MNYYGMLCQLVHGSEKVDVAENQQFRLHVCENKCENNSHLYRMADVG